MISFENLSFAYSPGRQTLRNVNLEIAEGELCLLVGPTGAGKSTLLGCVNGLVPHFTGGTLTGRVVVDGRDTRKYQPQDLADVVGYVGQDPLKSFVTDIVADEIAYAMEQLGISPAAMRKRIEETLDLMGIAQLRERPLAELSGGQQQRVAIAAVLAAQPQILVLDEPTSALDPTAAQDVLSAISMLVHEVGMTVVLAEHRLERVMHAADSMIWLPGTGAAEYGKPAQLLRHTSVIPPLAALARIAEWEDVPLSVRDARRRIQTGQPVLQLAQSSTSTPPSDTPALQANKITVRYGNTLAVNGVDLALEPGTVTAFMGRNGAGKSSLLWALAGGIPSTGRLSVAGHDPREMTPDASRTLITLVPQTAADLLYLPTVADELAQADKESAAEPGTALAILQSLGIELTPEQDPRDLSEGQRLALALAIQLTARPAVVLLDEPTRGLDYSAKDHLTQIVKELQLAGKAVAISTHDVEFAAAASTRVVLMADGDIIADGDTRTVVTSSPAYSPQMAKVFAPFDVITPSEVAIRLDGEVPAGTKGNPRPNDGQVAS
ncbi:MAG: ATP-binding cassette domain-containing protein [Propionibacteriaceae bacterium]|jgi:energy-coupling factor transport system ATP-binding protein|nr:ATP-binding cassette domain-containing protein [Propionibacteriaceae bacterium]